MSSAAPLRRVVERHEPETVEVVPMVPPSARPYRVVRPRRMPWWDLDRAPTGYVIEVLECGHEHPTSAGPAQRRRCHTCATVLDAWADYVEGGQDRIEVGDDLVVTIHRSPLNPGEDVYLFPHGHPNAPTDWRPWTITDLLNRLAATGHGGTCT